MIECARWCVWNSTQICQIPKPAVSFIIARCSGSLYPGTCHPRSGQCVGISSACPTTICFTNMEMLTPIKTDSLPRHGQQAASREGPWLPAHSGAVAISSTGIGWYFLLRAYSQSDRQILQGHRHQWPWPCIHFVSPKASQHVMAHTGL